MFIKVKVFPNSKKQRVINQGEKFEVWVKEKPFKGRANQAARDALANYFKISQEQVRLVSGRQKPNKILRKRDLLYGRIILVLKISFKREIERS